MPKVRLDSLLVERKLADSRARAQAFILTGNVYVAGHRVDKAGVLVPADASVEMRVPDHPYVSRGGAKLAGALDTFALSVQGLSCLDVGASTGGFTDCLLQRGAASVVAVDVGYGQLAHKLRVDPRVALHERTNARNLEPAQIGGPVDLSVVDASFISLRTLAARARALHAPGRRPRGPREAAVRGGTKGRVAGQGRGARSGAAREGRRWRTRGRR